MGRRSEALLTTFVARARSRSGCCSTLAIVQAMNRVEWSQLQLEWAQLHSFVSAVEVRDERSVAHLIEAMLLDYEA